MSEEWRDIPSCPGYQASSEGRIRSTDRRVNYSAAPGRKAYAMLRRGCVLKPALSIHGHLMVVAGGGTKTVHGLVAEAFHGPRPQHLEVRHLDGEHLNNKPGNLRYGTRKENVRDVLLHGGRQLTLAQARDIRVAIAEGATHNALARRYGVNRGTIAHIKSGKNYADV